MDIAEKIRLIAFYLPQYHPIPENDEWWGKGFTEWTNVAKAKPLFRRHYQPHLPADLGFYDLRLPEVRQSQADLAREHGIYGFCYYHYWFNGKRLLSRPFDEVLSSGKPDFPFCLCWANENWTRRWDGRDQDILLEQKYDFADDQKHIRALFPAFNDRRYIRIYNKPLFLVYRTELLPFPKQTVHIWREEALKEGIGELYIANVQSMGSYGDPADIGFDASVEFAPDWRAMGPKKNRLTSLVNRFSKKFGNGVGIYQYDNLVENMLRKPYPDYKLFRGVTPSWDNTPRRQEGAIVFVESTPDKYNNWLKEMIKQTKQRYSGDERIVFINAWNEWAEGNHLEPCQKWGRRYLDATSNAIRNATFSNEL